MPASDKPEKKLRRPSSPVGDIPVDDADKDGPIAGIEGRLKKRSVGKMTKLVDEHPDEAISTLRRWLQES